MLSKLSQKYSFCLWEKIDEDNSAVKICTSGLSDQDVDQLVTDINNIVNSEFKY